MMNYRYIFSLLRTQGKLNAQHFSRAASRHMLILMQYGLVDCVGGFYVLKQAPKAEAIALPEAPQTPETAPVVVSIETLRKTAKRCRIANQRGILAIEYLFVSDDPQADGKTWHQLVHPDLPMNGYYLVVKRGDEYIATKSSKQAQELMAA